MSEPYVFYNVAILEVHIDTTRRYALIEPRLLENLNLVEVEMIYKISACYSSIATPPVKSSEKALFSIVWTIFKLQIEH